MSKTQVFQDILNVGANLPDVAIAGAMDAAVEVVMWQECYGLHLESATVNRLNDSIVIHLVGRGESPNWMTLDFDGEQAVLEYEVGTHKHRTVWPYPTLDRHALSVRLSDVRARGRDERQHITHSGSH